MREQIEPWMLESCINTVRQQLAAKPWALMNGFWDYDLPFNLEERETVAAALDLAGIAHIKLELINTPSDGIPPSYALAIGRSPGAARRAVDACRASLNKFNRQGRGLTVTIVEHPPKVG